MLVNCFVFFAVDDAWGLAFPGFFFFLLSVGLGLELNAERRKESSLSYFRTIIFGLLF